ncbi:MAG: hypothetical protein HY878_00145 [Deltaproteobacteria bacterium]|nr:hypothetical protein [Deltaproteobacteria bacterium]
MRPIWENENKPPGDIPPTAPTTDITANEGIKGDEGFIETTQPPLEGSATRPPEDPSNPSDPEVKKGLKGLALSLTKLNEEEKAIPHLETFLKTQPYDKEALWAIYSAYIKIGEREKAAIYLERLSMLEPSNMALQEQLALMKRENRVERGFQSKEASHFVVRFDGKENIDLGHLISIILEEAYIKVGADIGYYPDDRIGVVLYTQEEFRDVTRSPSWAGAIYDGRIKIPAGGITTRTALLERVVFHEYTHALVHRLSKNRAPVWLNEGLAQHEEGSRSSSPEKANIIDQIARLVAQGQTIPLYKLEGSFMGLNQEAAMVSYALSLSVTEYIIKEFGISAVKRILEKLGNGKTLEAAIQGSLSISYQDLNKGWLSNLKRRVS